MVHDTRDPSVSATERYDAGRSGRFLIGGTMSVTRLGFGAMRITGPHGWGEPLDRAGTLRLLHRVRDLGIDLIDTADSYGPFVSEELIAEVFGATSGVRIATKAGFVRYPGNPAPWPRVGDPHYLRQCVHLSMRRLGVERLDLWQLHCIDPKVPRDEQFDAIRSFLNDGLIAHAGLSQVSVAEIEAAQAFFPVATVQNCYNLTDRASEDVVRFCEANDIGFIPFYPLAGGGLVAPGGTVARIAGQRGLTPAQLSIAWLLQRSPVMLPIPGTSSIRHLEENVAAAGVVLSESDYKALESIVPPG
ncbi:oxidoreductase [Sphingomonas melonis TY]|uniref:Oxidoreductase n=1 Tax=Sphingomonas melonis TY TaxID=621456 RepID=A0A175Y0U7_9SPHN|nr:aldo/keto reductase [Sphingomonas melonis]KZB93570.1 oxidoreductase [Sphingomonas melonis TY]